MTKVCFITSDGMLHEIEAALGETLMQVAKYNDVPGIDATCGGACACATCHVYVDAAWFDLLPPASEGEREMLQFSEGVRDNSRLACQIELTVSMDGLTVVVPESQE